MSETKQQWGWCKVYPEEFGGGACLHECPDGTEAAGLCCHLSFGHNGAHQADDEKGRRFNWYDAEPRDPRPTTDAGELTRLLLGLPDAILSVQNADDGGKGGDHARNVARACELFLTERVKVAAKIVRLEKALADMTADRDFLKRRERDIIEACERVADGGQYRADIVSAINRIRSERDEARARVAELEARLARGGEEHGK
jgi:hypothetical protein